ncbi:O-antigen polysaccharide polymerase Wzy [Paenibacillus chitinolyticus]|uniref:O-antigen polysaccharide polymerase Wzy n=1 Tax=Paenibacillus chitinolyticus TaxID=79263 RepID=UPI003D02F3F6
MNSTSATNVPYIVRNRNLKSGSVLFRSYFLLLTFLSLFTLLALQMYFYISLPPWSPDLVSLLALLSSGTGLLHLILNKNVKIFGFVGIYAIYLSLAHLGFVFVDLVFEHSNEIMKTNYNLDWFYKDYRLIAVSLSGISITCFVLCASFASKYKAVQNKRLAITNDRNNYQIIYMGGIALLVFSILFLMYNILTGNLPLFSGYMNYRTAMEDVPGYSIMLFCLSTGITFAFASGTRKQIFWSAMIFIIPSLLLLISGNRGEVLYPLAAAIGVLFTRGIRINFKLILGALLLFNVVIPLLQQTRNQELTEFDIRETSVSFVDPMAEIGYTLRPLVYTVGWMQKGEEHAYGSSYLLPINRLASSFVPFIKKSELEGNYYIKPRLPGQGYSVIAEAYFNFGLIGVIIVQIFLALFIVILGERSSNIPMLALFGAIMAILINNIRNTFIFVPGQLLLLVGIFCLFFFLGKRKNIKL